jgi:hypothetical protein
MRISVELATIIHARRSVDTTFKSYTHGEILPPIYRDFRVHHDETLKSKAIELAANLRVFLDVDEIDDFLDPDVQLGEFLKPNKDPMTLRDCANKLLHALGYVASAEMTGIGSSGTRKGPPLRRALSEEVEMNGVNRGQTWECRVDLLRFAEASYELTFHWDPS